MADTNNAHDKEVKVEDLLRLKRAERPSEAFWNTFDRELHQRMLQTLVKKDPWYVQALRGISGRIAQTAAVGAAAAFLAMMVVRPAFVNTAAPSSNGAQFAQEAVASAPQVVEVAMSDLEDLDLNSLLPTTRLRRYQAQLQIRAMRMNMRLTASKSHHTTAKFM